LDASTSLSNNFGRQKALLHGFEIVDACGFRVGRIPEWLLVKTIPNNVTMTNAANIPIAIGRVGSV
jgi:hypothetical protein